MRNPAAVILIFLCVFICIIFLRKEDKYEVLKIVSSTEFYVDYNQNKVAEENELLQLFELDTEPENLSFAEASKLNYLGKTFAKQKLLNKYIKIISYPNEKHILILPNNQDYTKLLNEKGYIQTDFNKEIVKKNLEYANSLNLVSYNTLSHKFHTFDCKYAFSSPNEEIIKTKDLPANAQPCKFCLLNPKIKRINNYKTDWSVKYPRDVYEKYSPLYKDSGMEFYVTDFTKYYYPSNKCLTTPCKSLLREINSAKSTIDFAIYGIDNQPAITDALIRAHKRGVKVRWVFDTDKSGNTIYLETLKLKKSLTDSKADIELVNNILPNGKKLKDSIMHNKFFVFDKKKVWTGSANVSHTDLSGFNANAVFLFDSSKIAKIYEKEFEQMYSGYFHQTKSTSEPNMQNIADSEISVYFSPQDRIINNHILKLINNSKKYVYVPVFVITHKDFTQSLINAKNRGVDVKVVVDATSAGSKYSSVKVLRDSNVKVKVENRAGKMHMKSIIIDDMYVVTGSMNFTKSGESFNDENVLIIKNSRLTKAFKDKFIYFYNSIPDKWLYKNPGAESKNSINSCYDGIDNDFDGKIDMQDDSCNFKLKKNKKTSQHTYR